MSRRPSQVNDAHKLGAHDEFRRATAERIFDRHGSVSLGHADGDILCARFEHHVSDRVGEAYAGRLHDSVGTISKVRYLLDLSELTSIDLLARSTLVRTVLARR